MAATSGIQRLWYLLVWQLAIIAPIIEAQGSSPITWVWNHFNWYDNLKKFADIVKYSKTLGMGLQLLLTSELTCPQTLGDALSNSSYLPIYASNNSIFAGSQIPDTSISHFYLTNGWHTPGSSYDSNAYTNIMLVEAVGNCWSVNQIEQIVVLPCDLSSNQTFYVSYLFTIKKKFEVKNCTR